MILDMQTLFSGTVAADGTKTGQSITATANSTNVLDLRQSATLALADEALQGGQPLWLSVLALTAAAGGDSAKTLTITLVSDSATSLASSPVTHASTTAIAGSAITANAILWRFNLPSDNYKRYLGLIYTASATFTAFSVTAWMSPNIDRSVIYPKGFTVA